MQERYKKLLTDTGLFAVSNFGSKILTFVLLPVYTSILTTEEYGFADIVISTINLLYPVLTLSIFDATLRFALDKKYDKKIIFCITLVCTCCAIFSFLVGILFFSTMDSLIGSYCWCIFGLFVTTCFQTCLSYYIKGCSQTKIFAIQGVIYTFVCLSSNIVLLVVTKMGLTGYFFSMIIAGTVSCIYMLLASRCYRDLIPITFEKNTCKEMLKYSIPLIPTTIAWWINASADKYMILGLIGVGANGLYGVAHKIPTVFSTFSSLFSQAWRISAISSFDDKDKRGYYEKVYRIYSLICIYACVCIIFISELLAKILFKSDYYMAWILVPPLLLAALFEAYAGFLASIYAAAKCTTILSLSTCIGAVLNIFLNYFLIEQLGVLGAPIATMVSFIIVWLLRLRIMQSFMPMKINMGQLIISNVIVIACGLYFSFQGPNKYIVWLISIMTIVTMNFQETKHIILFCTTIAKKTMKNKGGRNLR